MGSDDGTAGLKAGVFEDLEPADDGSPITAETDRPLLLMQPTVITPSRRPENLAGALESGSRNNTVEYHFGRSEVHTHFRAANSRR